MTYLMPSTLVLRHKGEGHRLNLFGALRGGGRWRRRWIFKINWNISLAEVAQPDVTEQAAPEGDALLPVLSQALRAPEIKY